MLPEIPDSLPGTIADTLHRRTPYCRETALLQWLACHGALGAASGRALEVDTLVQAGYHGAAVGWKAGAEAILSEIGSAGGADVDAALIAWLARIETRLSPISGGLLLAFHGTLTEGAAAAAESVSSKVEGLRLACFGGDTGVRAGWLPLARGQEGSRVLVRDVFDAAAGKARELGCAAFMVCRGSHCVTPTLMFALERLRGAGYRNLCVSATETAGPGKLEPQDWVMMRVGSPDAFLCATDVWTALAPKVRAYVLSDQDHAWQTGLCGAITAEPASYFLSHLRGALLAPRHAAPEATEDEKAVARENRRILERDDLAGKLCVGAYVETLQAFIARQRSLPSVRLNERLLPILRGQLAQL